jgi:hypothetical protein
MNKCGDNDGPTQCRLRISAFTGYVNKNTLIFRVISLLLMRFQAVSVASMNVSDVLAATVLMMEAAISSETSVNFY